MNKGSNWMKRVLSFVMALAMMLTLMPAVVLAADTGTTLYLKPNSNWLVDNARFAIYYWNSSGSNWVSMSDADGDGYYEATVPAGYTNIIFCRMNPSATANNWNNKWNQTADLTVPTDGTNCYTVAAGTWDKGGGTWSSYTYQVTFETNGGTAVADQDVVPGATATEPDAPTRDGYDFAGWYKDADLTEAYDFTAAVTADLILYAKWEEQVTEEETTEPTEATEPSEGENESETITVYFRNDWLWPDVYIYYWNAASVNNTWPGEKMTFVETLAEGDVYSAKIPADSVGIIFNGLENGNASNRQQTPDVTGFEDGSAYYIHWDGENKCSNFDYTPGGSGGEGDGGDEGETTATYIVAGTYVLCGTEWDLTNTANKMTLGEDGLYTITYKSVYPGEHKFKVTDGTWNNCWGGGDDTDGNTVFTLEAISDVTITFNADTKTITVTSTATGEAVEYVDCEVKLHFANTLGWSNVCAYVWDATGNLTNAWPGNSVALDADGFYTYTATVEMVKGQTLNFIFNNGDNGLQTADLSAACTANADGTYSIEKWVQLGDEVTGDDGNGTGKYNATLYDSADAIVISPVVDGTSVTFEYRNASASSVYVAGTFNGWDITTAPVAMTKNDYGVWSVTIEDVTTGTHRYKFWVDGVSVLDPANTWTYNESDGYTNSAFIVLDPDAVDTNTVTVKVHFYREAGYDGWNLWVWNGNMGGHQVDFETVGTERIATIELKEARSHMDLSFIPRYSTVANKWADELPTYTVDLSNIVSGTIDYYVTAGNSSGMRVLNTDVKTGNKIAAAELNYDTGKIDITTTVAISDPADEITIVDAEGEEVDATVTTNGTTYSMSLTDVTLDLVTLYQYKIKFDGYTYDIDINTVYASDKFAAEFTYDGKDLGATWTSESTTFKVWAPTAEAVSVKLYATGSDTEENAADKGTYAMTKGEKGVWTVTVSGNLSGTYYTYAVKVNNETVEAVDPYARTTGVNGERGMVIDLDSTDPDGWDEDVNPNKIGSYTDAIIYELHVRDFSIDDSSGVPDVYQGKYLAFTEEGTVVPGTEISTGIDYLDELGVTHVHLLPVYDYASVDETTCDGFNWGYDPQNYNAPEGSYSTDPYSGEVRVNEFKQMVKSLHDHDISVIMDVVYNHVYNADTFCFNQIVPGYFSRVDSNSSGCGNDTASEREMVRKYIVESVLYWHQEYHIDGFRFDLVGLLDVETINQIVEEVHACCPDVIFYGEGWDMDDTNKEAGTEMAKQGNAYQTEGFAYFSDSMRNGIAGSNGTSTGFASGAGNGKSMVTEWLGKPSWTSNPQQVVQYVSCHDNYTLIDKLILSTGATGITDNIISMNNLAAAMYMTSMGIPFIHAGEEMLREKLEEDGDRCENSYNASDYVNSIKWDNLENGNYADTVDYYTGLIAFRNAHAALRYSSSADVSKYVKNVSASEKLLVFSIDGFGAGDDDIYVIFNGNSTSTSVSLPSGEWTIYINKENAGTTSLGTATGSVTVDGISAMVLTKADEGENKADPTVTLYFTNTKGWESVYAYAWDENNTYLIGAWPGSAMAFVETNDYSQSVYSIAVPATATSIIFNDGSGNQTEDLTVGVDGTGYYIDDSGVCQSYTYRDPYGSADDYYLFGYIDGANYGCEDNYTNLGDYKFVDGTVTATFTQDSYVGVKTGDNGTWYMTDGWLGNVTSATLANAEGLGGNANKLMVPGGMKVTFTLTENEDGTLTLSYEAKESETSYSANDASGIQDGVTLHCWNWSFAEIEKNMETIAAQGYTAIQTSPVQPIKEATTDSTDTVSGCWWLYYQPVGFTITDDEGNVLGTKDELVSMINTAHQYGIKVIVDVVANHMANNEGNDLSAEIPESISGNSDYWHNITQNTSDYSSRFEVTQYCMAGLPDLNTGNDYVQAMVLAFLKECIDIGVDGFRFDAAKHIETPLDDKSIASDFWPTVIGGAEEYAQSKGRDIYCYGEVLDSLNGVAVSAYTEYMAITDNSWGNTLRENISVGTAAISEGYDKPADASQLVIWAESHDTYANDDGASKDETEAEINKTWALVAARADAMGLYLARPASDTQLLGVASVTGWANAEVKAANQFHNAFVGQSETVGTSGNIAYVVRGTTGIVLVNAVGTTVTVTINVGMEDGTYTDQITGNTFTVTDGTISGTIGATGIAVVCACKDGNTDHKCDLCGDVMGTHEAAQGTHTCEYCGQIVTECGVITVEYGGGSFGIHNTTVAALKSSTFIQSIGTEALMNKVNACTQIEGLESLLEDTNFISYLQGIGVSVDELSNLGNAAVLYVAYLASGMTTEEISEFLTRTNKKSIIIENLQEADTYGIGLTQAALAYGMYNAYAYYTENSDLIECTNDIMAVMECIDDAQFIAFIQEEQAQKDLEGYLATLRIENSISRSPETVNAVLENGFNADSFIQSMNNVLDSYSHNCSACGKKITECEAIVVAGKAPGCTETGLSEGTKCVLCGEVLVAQEEIPAQDHIDQDGDYKCDYDCGTLIGAVAQIGDTYYGSLADAVNAVAEGGSIKLLADVTEEVLVSKAVTIEKNGYTAAITAGDGYEVAETETAYTVSVEVLTGSIRLRSAALNLLDKVCIVYRATDDLIATNNEDVAERGVLLYASAELAATRDPSQAYETVVLEWNADEERYIGQTEGIDARDMDKSQFAVAYLKMTDGTYIFGTREGVEHSVEYSPLIYCQNKKNDALVGMLCRALMHYGAAAQVEQYGMTTGLMNEGFDPIPYDESVLGESVFSVNTDVVNGIKLRSAMMDLKGAISYIVTFSVEDTSIADKQLYAEYTLLGETGSVELVPGTDDRLWATISGVPAKDMGATLTVRAYYLDENGEKVYGGELVYSGYEYIRRAMVNTSYTDEVKELAKALAMYIHYADAYGN